MRRRLSFACAALVIVFGIAAYFLYTQYVSRAGENLTKFYALEKEDPLILPPGAAGHRRAQIARYN